MNAHSLILNDRIRTVPAAPPLLPSSSQTTRPCRPFPRRGSFRLESAVAKLPLLVRLRPPWAIASLMRVLLHTLSLDQPARRASHARLGPPRLQMFSPNLPSTLFRLCRFRPTTDAATPAPPLVGTLPPHAPRRASTPAALPEIPSPAEIEFIEYFERRTHSDRAREQCAEPVCDTVTRYLFLGCPLLLPNDFFLHLAPHKRPLLSEVRSLADKERLYIDDDGILRLVRKLTPPALARPNKSCGRAARLLDDEPMRIYFSLLMRPWIIQPCHANASCDLGVDRTLSMLERIYCWIGMSICTRWRLRRCLQCQTRKASRQAVRWPILSLPLPSGPGVAVIVDYLGPLPVTPRENCYILLFTDRLSRRVDMYAVSTAEFTAEGTADLLVNISLWGCPFSFVSDNGLRFCSKLSHAVYKILGMRKIPQSAYHPNGKGDVERVNHTIAQMLAMVCNEIYRDWDVHLSHVEFAHNVSFSAATGSAPNEVYLNRFPCLPLTMLEQHYARGH